MTKKRTAEPSGKSNHQLQDKGYKKLFSNKEMFLEFLQTFVKEDWVRDINTEDLDRVDKEYILNYLPSFRLYCTMGVRSGMP